MSSKERAEPKLLTMPLMQTWTQRPDTINRILGGKLLVNADDAAALSEAISPTMAHNIHIAPIKNRKTFMNQENSTSLKCEIKAALMAAGISAKEVENKGQVLSRVEASFVKDRPRAWWSSLAVAPKIYTFNDNSAYLHLDEVAPPTTDDVWLIVDEDNDEKFVFSLPLSKIKNIIEECRYFEYYIVDKNLKWLLAENDHGDLIFSEKNLTP